MDVLTVRDFAKEDAPSSPILLPERLSFFRTQSCRLIASASFFASLLSNQPKPNTADKSIALVDIALRRRFQFVPIYPNADVINNFCKSSDKEEKFKFMSALNLRLRNDKGVDFQVGHAYFLNENSLNDVINENIVPLLIEYFRNDLEKVRGLMKDLNRSIDEDHYNNTGLLKYIG